MDKWRTALNALKKIFTCCYKTVDTLDRYTDDRDEAGAGGSSNANNTAVQNNQRSIETHNTGGSTTHYHIQGDFNFYARSRAPALSDGELENDGRQKSYSSPPAMENGYESAIYACRHEHSDVESLYTRGSSLESLGDLGIEESQDGEIT